MAIVHNLTFNIAAKIGNFTKPLRKITNDLNRMKRDMSLWGKTITGPFRMAGRTISSAFSLMMKPVSMFIGLLNRLKFMAIGAFGAITYFVQSSGRGFQDAMNQMQAVLQGTNEEFGKLRQRAMELSQFSVGPQEAAEAMKILALAGSDAKTIYEQMPAVVTLANASLMGVADASNTVVSVMNQMGYKAAEMPGVMDLLAKASANANFELQDMGEAFKYIGPGAKQAGVDLKTLLVMQQMMANSGIKGSMAGTSTRNIIARLAGATPAVAKRLHKMGVVVKDAAGRMRPMADIITQLISKTSQMDDLDASALMTNIFGMRGGPGMAAIIEQGPERFIEAMRSLDDASGFATRQASANFRGLTGPILNLGIAIKKVAADFLQMITPNLSAWIQMLTKWISENHKAIVMWGVNFYKWVIKISGAFIQWVQQLFADPAGTIGKAISFGIDIGQSIIDGLINSIRNNAGAIGAALKDVMKEAGLGWIIGIGDKAKSAKETYDNIRTLGGILGEHKVEQVRARTGGGPIQGPGSMMPTGFSGITNARAMQDIYRIMINRSRNMQNMLPPGGTTGGNWQVPVGGFRGVSDEAGRMAQYAIPQGPKALPSGFSTKGNFYNSGNAIPPSGMFNGGQTLVSRDGVVVVEAINRLEKTVAKLGTK